MSTNFAKTLVWKQDCDVKLWRHKQPTPNTNDYPMPLNETPPHENFLRTPLHKYVLTTNEVRAWLSKSYAISNATTCSRPRTKTAKQELYWFSVRACVRSVRIATCDFNAAIMFHNQLQERLEVSKTDLKYVLSIRTEDG